MSLSGHESDPAPLAHLLGRVGSPGNLHGNDGRREIPRDAVFYDPRADEHAAKPRFRLRGFGSARVGPALAA